MVPHCDFPGCEVDALFLVENRHHACATHLAPAVAHVLQQVGAADVEEASGAVGAVAEHAAYWTPA